MHSLLKSIQEQPSADIEQHHPTDRSTLSPELRQQLLAMHRSSFDWEHGGLRLPVKFLDIDAVEYSLRAAALGDVVEAKMARLTLDGAASLLDPVWGGVFPHATRTDWSSPQYQKPMAAQARSLRLYSMAYSLWQRPQDLERGTRIVQYLNDFLSAPDGRFFSGQAGEPDSGLGGRDYFTLTDPERRQHGVPRVDRCMRLRENGWAIEALTAYANSCGSNSALDRARRAANQLILPPLWQRKLPTTSKDNDLTDLIALGRSLLALHAASADRAGLVVASKVADCIGANFASPAGGFRRISPGHRSAAAAALADDNIAMTRFANLLFHYTKQPRHYALARHGMRYLSAPHIATARVEDAGILLAADELAKPPTKYVIYGAKTDARAKALFACAHRQFGGYKLVQWREVSIGQEGSASITLSNGHSSRVSTPAELEYASLAYRAAA